MMDEGAKKKYGIWSNLFMVLKDMRCAGYRYYLYLAADIVLQILIPFVLVLLPGLITGMLVQNREPAELLFTVAALTGAVFCMNLAKDVMDQKYTHVTEILRESLYTGKIYQRLLLCGMAELEDPQMRAVSYTHLDVYKRQPGTAGCWGSPEGFICWRWQTLQISPKLWEAAVCSRLSSTAA